jgi:hypothetical protein
VPVTYAAMAALYFAGNGHAYYLATLYPLLLGLGSVRTSEWTARGSRQAGALIAAIALSAAISAVVALPLLPERQLQGSVVIALNPAQGETVGWPRFAATIAGAWRQIPAAERHRTAIFATNYGEAGALDLFGPALHLPRPYSAHNAYSEWGRPPADDGHALVIGDGSAAEAAPWFARCRTLATIDDGVGLNNDEQGLRVMLCRPTASWAALWPRLRHYD